MQVKMRIIYKSVIKPRVHNFVVDTKYAKSIIRINIANCMVEGIELESNRSDIMHVVNVNKTVYDKDDYIWFEDGSSMMYGTENVCAANLEEV